MASDQSTPKDHAAGAPRRAGGPYNSGASHKSGSAPRKDGAPYKSGGAPRKDGAPYKSGSAPSKDGAASSGRPPYGGSKSGGGKSGGSYRGGASGGPRGDRPARPDRDERPVRKGPPAPEIPEDVVIGQLDKTVRARLRTLSKENAEDVGRHLIMAGNLLETDPELAYSHAIVAASRAGRVDVVREAAAVTAYATGRYAEALREFRTVRRLNGSSEHLPLMADCERGLGRPERAIALSQEPEASTLDATGRVELAIVVAGARNDMGNGEAALVSLKRLTVNDPELKARVDEATAGILRSLGRDEEADAIEPAAVAAYDDFEEDVVVFDTVEVDTVEVDTVESDTADEVAKDGTRGTDR